MCLFKCMFVCASKSFAFWNVFVFLAISQPPQCREETLKTVKMISFCSRLHSITAAEGLAKGEVTTFTGLIYFHPDKKQSQSSHLRRTETLSDDFWHLMQILGL